VFVNSRKLGATWVKSELQNRNGDEDWIERMGSVSTNMMIDKM
jgi:hypothetical protein